MDWQQTVALTIVGITALLFLRARWKRRHGLPSACGGDCCKLASHGPTPRYSILLKARRGERAQVHIRQT